MIHHLFTIHDATAECYLPPFSALSKGEALRMFMDTCADPSHQFHRHSKDFTLFYLGTYDNADASFQNLSTPEPMAKAIELIQPSLQKAIEVTQNGDK